MWPVMVEYMFDLSEMCVWSIPSLPDQASVYICFSQMYLSLQVSHKTALNPKIESGILEIFVYVLKISCFS